MKVLKHVPKVENGQVAKGEFNNCEHLFISLEPDKIQTISVALPSGQFVTLSFINGQGGEFECMDIHTTAGKTWAEEATGKIHWNQALLGFSKGGSTSFDTRKLGNKTNLATLLLSKKHNS